MLLQPVIFSLVKIDLCFAGVKGMEELSKMEFLKMTVFRYIVDLYSFRAIKLVRDKIDKYRF